MECCIQMVLDLKDVLGALNGNETYIDTKLVQLHDFIDNEMVEDVIKKSIPNKTLNGTYVKRIYT